MSLKVVPKPGFLINPLHSLSRDLAGWWLLNEGNGIHINNYAPKSIAQDGLESLNGTLTEVDPVSAWSDSPSGSGTLLIGGNERIVIDASVTTTLFLDQNKPLSISWWEKVANTPPASVFRGRCQFTVQGSSDRFVCYRSNQTGYNTIVWGRAPNTNLGIRSTAIPTLADSVGIWNHFVISGPGPLTTDPSSYRLWLNGLEYTTSQSSSLAATTTANAIGKVGAGAAICDATIADFRLYQRLLNDSDVQELFNNPFGNVLTNRFPKFVSSLSTTVIIDPSFSAGRRQRRLLYARF